ncbi:hypothetical protein BN6_20190 [Saccharothrix espanaensis DSM 44229]|uniref:Uncharacterized protein n=1 Tax=Saccharothrix espanaensis (strain ATCC 51144 / DSM 44229 / JCM 9112 / NBRC 15066 / NRRL 15764) TaxID=1179773 RepID=K0JTT4_SACES|nr:hypothetical protein BN6_20190 [Saccharothrix espanaensis DSM 44229]
MLSGTISSPWCPQRWDLRPSEDCNCDCNGRCAKTLLQRWSLLARIATPALLYEGVTNEVPRTSLNLATNGSDTRHLMFDRWLGCAAWVPPWCCFRLVGFRVFGPSTFVICGLRPTLDHAPSTEVVVSMTSGTWSARLGRGTAVSVDAVVAVGGLCRVG